MRSIMTIIFCVLCFYMQAQKAINAEKRESQKQSLTIVTPFVLYGEISDFNLIEKLRDSLFDTHVLPEEFKRNAQYEKDVHDFIIEVYKKYLRKHYDLNFVKISGADSTIMANELKRMKVKKNDSAGATINISTSMDKIFSKYSKEDSIFMMTSVTDYYLKGAYSGHRSKSVAWTFLEVFIIDSQKKEIIFYNNKINKWRGGPGGVIPCDIKKTLKGFVKRK